ncbi:ABC transporter ATP-binding protein [Devosia sp. A369]
MTTIALKNVGKSYGSAEILKDVNLEIASGEFVVFVGPSGCGKSTLLRCISGLEEISTGELYLDGMLSNDVAPSRRGVAMVFQSYALYPHMTVYENMGYSLKLQKLSKAAIRAKVEEAAAKLELTKYLDRLPKDLSGGQRQRVAIGRSIVRDPKIFLFDEPLSNLDASLRVQMRLEIAALNEQLPNTTMVYVTHDQVEAMTLADRIVVLKDGVIQQIGTPLELYETPRTQFVAGFIGSPKMNFLSGPFAQPFGAPTVGIRAEHLELDLQSGSWSGKVIHSENLGSDNYVYVDLGSTELVVVRLGGRIAVRAGDMVYLTPTPSELHRFDVQGNTLAAA